MSHRNKRLVVSFRYIFSYVRSLMIRRRKCRLTTHGAFTPVEQRDPTHDVCLEREIFGSIMDKYVVENVKDRSRGTHCLLIEVSEARKAVALAQAGFKGVKPRSIVLQKRQLFTKPDLADASRYYRVTIT